MTRRSIVLQIVWRHIVALAVVSLAVSIAAHNLLIASTNEFIENMLEDRAAELARYISAPGGQWQVQLPDEMRSAYARHAGGIVFALENEKGEARASTFPNDPAPFTGTARDSSRRSSTFGKEDRSSGTYFALAIPLERDGHQGWLKIARRLDDPDVVVDDVASHFYERIFLVVVPIIVLLLLVDIVIIHRALAPLRTASDIASGITASKLDVRLPMAAMPDEIRPLAQAINEALERLQHAFEHQRDFTADAAHELRTPLTVLRTHLDLLPKSSEARALQPDVMAMCRIVDQLLDLADLEALTIWPDDGIDLRAACEEAVSVMAPIALIKQKSVGFTAPEQPVLIAGNMEMIVRAVRNLIDNAIRHTPVGSAVDVEVTAGGEVTVADSGRGIDPAQREFIFKRFWRGDRREKEHSGLGLSIVAQVAKLHGASLDVGTRAGGGAVFKITFPRVPSANAGALRPPSHAA